MARTTGLLELLVEESRIREIVRSEVINLEATRKSPNFRLEWNEFSGGKGLFTIDIKAPLLEGSNSPLLETTFSGIAIATGEDGVEPVMAYQVQFASDGSFTSNLEIFDLGIRRTAEIKAENISRHAKARARIIPGGSWSEWNVSGSGAVASGSAFDTTVDDLDDINDGTTHGKVVNTALTSNQPDLSKAGVLNRTQDNIADTASRAAVNPDTLTSNRPDLAKSIQNKVLTNIADDGTFRKTAIAFIDSSNRITTIRKTTGAINVAGDDLFKYTGASAQNLDNVGEGATFGKVNLTALTSNNVDLSKAGVTNKTLQHIADQGTTRQAVTGNEKTGAGRGFNALNSSNRLTTGITNRTVAVMEAVVGSDSRAKALDLTSISTGNLDNISDGASFAKSTANQNTGGTRGFDNILSGGEYKTIAFSRSLTGPKTTNTPGGSTTQTVFTDVGSPVSNWRLGKDQTSFRARCGSLSGTDTNKLARIRVGGNNGTTVSAVGSFSIISGLTADSTISIQVQANADDGVGNCLARFDFVELPQGEQEHYQ